MDKHYSLLQKSVNYGSKIFYNTGSRFIFYHVAVFKLKSNGMYNETFNGRN
jgi:hypothetical protein